MSRTKIEDLSILLSADASGIASGLRSAARQLDDFKKRVESRGNADMGGARMAAKEAAAHKRAAKEAADAWHSVGVSRSFIAGAAGGAVALAGMTAMQAGIRGVAEAFQQAKESINLAAESEQVSLAFEVMLNSAEKAKEMLGGLRSYAASTPFGLKDVNDAGRMLIGFDTAADQVIPTVRMLGDVSAGTGKELKELTYLYASMMSQDRPYTVDIKQFATAGIPIWKELAKVMGVAKSELRDMVEDGRVGNRDVKRAFASMTGPGGLYYGLTERQGQTFAGVREQMLDSIQQLKTRFGQTLIDQMGLKTAAKDFTAFVQNIDSQMPRIERAAKFTGDLAKGAAQLAFEFGKAGIAIAGMNLEGLARVSPEFASAMKEGKAFFENVQHMRLDEENVARFGLDIFKAVARPLAQVVDYVSIEGKSFLDAFEKNFLNPVKEFAELLDKLDPRKIPKAVNDAILPDSMKAIRDANQERFANRNVLREAGVRYPPADMDWMLREMTEIVKGAKDLPFFNPPRADEPLENVKFRFAHLERLIARGEFLAGPVGNTDLAPYVEALKKQRGEMLMPYSADPGRHFKELQESFKKGVVPPRRADWVDIAPPKVEKTKTQRFDEALEAFSKEVLKQAAEAKATRIAIDQQKQAAKDASNAFVGLAGGAMFAAKELASIKMPERPADVYEVPADVRQAAKDAKAQFPDIGVEFRKQYARLQAAVLLGELDIPTFERAGTDLINRTAGQLGIGGPTELPDTALRGSTEATRLINQAMNGNGQQRVEDLLRLIEEHTRKAKDTNENMDRKAQPVQPVKIGQ